MLKRVLPLLGELFSFYFTQAVPMGPAGLLLSTVASTKHSQGSHLKGETDSKKLVNTETGYDYLTVPDVKLFQMS